MPLREITAAEAARLLADEAERTVLLDCREDEELAIASIAGALHIPMGDIPSRLPELDPEKRYVVCCHHGVRSAQVCLFLASNDFDDVANLRGGIDAWSREVDPDVPRY